MSSQNEGFHPLCMIWSAKAIIKNTSSSLTFTIIKPEYKVLYCAARPNRVQKFMTLDSFLGKWSENNQIFVQNPPEISIAYTNMSAENDEIAYSIPIQLNNPHKIDRNIWQFNLSFIEKKMSEGTYHEIALFIDWMPSAECPPPVQILFSRDYK